MMSSLRKRMWKMITNDRMIAFIDSFDKGNTPFLNQIEKEAKAARIPIIRPATQKLLRFLMAAKRPLRILEVGTAVGFSALLMSEYAPKGCRITTIEKYEKRIPAARENFRRAGREETITLLEGDAAKVLQELQGTYDFIFMDAAKGQYIHFLPHVLRLLAPEGMLVSDNVLQDGDVLESRFAVTRRNRTIHARMREYLYTLTHDAELETVILPVGDGISLTVKKQEQKEAWRLEKEKLVEEYRQANRSALRGQVVCTGSSLMEMFPVEEWVKELGEEGPVVYNRGVGGYTTKDLLPILDVCVLDLAPKKVFINIGTNDLNDEQEPLEEIMRRYEEILNVIERSLPETTIYLMAYYPVNYEAASEKMKPCLRIRTNEKIDQANKEVEKLAQKHGLRYIDLNAPLRDEQGRLKAEYTTEGMHIRPEGYRAVFPEFMAYVRE